MAYQYCIIGGREIEPVLDCILSTYFLSLHTNQRTIMTSSPLLFLDRHASQIFPICTNLYPEIIFKATQRAYCHLGMRGESVHKSPLSVLGLPDM